MFFFVTRREFHRTINFLKEDLMAAIDDLNTRVVALTGDVDAVKAKVADLKAAQVVGVPEADVQAAADKLAAVHDALQAAIA